MSEYWKSTPKIWCKHCKIFIRDTKLEKTNHDATPKHQGNLKRFIRDLHRGHEKDEKDKQRAKDEVARLNGLPTVGQGSSSSSSANGSGSAPSLPKPQATAAQRKQQLAQLAEMGISIPDEFRPDMALAGEWQVTAQRVLEPDGEVKVDAKAMGVKRELENDEDDEDAAEIKKKRWGSKFRTHPVEEADTDLDALLNMATAKSNTQVTGAGVNPDPAIKLESLQTGMESDETKESIDQGAIKKEPLGEMADIPTTVPTSDVDVVPKQEGEKVGNSEVVFKKRKAKNIRQK